MYITSVQYVICASPYSRGMDEKDNISKVVTNILDGRRYSMDGLGKD